MADHFDLIVLGAGPAGEKAAITSAYFGKKVAIVEKDPYVGGTAINTGTVPSKTLRETALALSGLRSRDLHGVDLSLRRGCTIEDFLRHERAVKVAERDQIRGRLEHVGIEIFRGSGAFVDPHTIHVRGTGQEATITSDHIVIAIGSRPLRPPGIPFEHDRVHDSDELLEIKELPKSMAVIGAGVIGSEYACMFAALGVNVALIDGRNKLLPFLDGEISRCLTSAMEDLGVTFFWNETVTHIEAPEKGYVKLSLSSGRKMPVDHALVCAGRAARTSEINPAVAGLEVAEKGRVVVNEHYQTNVPHIYAVGDVIGFPALASTSAEQGRIAACHAFDKNFLQSLSRVLPTGIYTIPEVSCAGETEESLKKAGIDYVIGRASYKHCPRGKIIGDKFGFLKLLCARDSLKILGVHVLGELASEVVHTGVMALMLNENIDFFLRMCFNYPTLGELYKYAAYDAMVRNANRA